jgi:hypothetical protein
MLSEPTFTVTKQLLDFGIAYPVVLVIVQHGDKHVEMGDEILQAHLGSKPDCEVRAVSPVRKFLVEPVSLRRYGVAERLKQPTQNVFSAPTRKH